MGLMCMAAVAGVVLFVDAGLNGGRASWVTASIGTTAAVAAGGIGLSLWDLASFSG
jgi:hypothetical protein